MRRRQDPLPRVVRQAIDDVERLYVAGTDEQYAAAVDALRVACIGLPASSGPLIDHALAQAQDRAEDAAHLARMQRALAGSWTPLQTLPGDVELVALEGAPGEHVLVVVPAHRPGADAAETDRVNEARAALRVGECGHCRARLALQVTGHLTLPHATSCPLHDRRLRRITPST